MNFISVSLLLTWNKYLPSGTLQNYSYQISVEKDTGRQCAVFAAETIERNKNIAQNEFVVITMALLEYSKDHLMTLC